VTALEILSSVFNVSNFSVLYDAFRTAIGGVEWFVLAYFICIAVFFIIGKDYMNDGFVYPLFFMILTVFNPFLIVPLAGVIGLLPRIRRLFWLLPVNLTLAFVFTCMAFAPRKKITRAAVTLGIAALVALGGTSVVPYLHMPENIYKVSNVVVDISELIESDSQEHGLNKSTLYSSVNLLTLRQYDPSILSALRRSDLIDWSIDPEDTKAVNKVLKSGHVLHTLALVSRYEIEIDADTFLSYMTKMETPYVITEPGRELEAYLTSMGFEKIGDFDGYRVYRNLDIDTTE
jgi:hypothetical protein